MARYDLVKARTKIDREALSLRKKGIWRWEEFLPVRKEENRIYLGEGDTPLLKMSHLADERGLLQLFVKDESLNPTGSFKARGLAVAISKAKELGVKRVIIPTAGNAGGAMAAYAAKAGLEACVYMPRDTPFANVEECLAAGAQVILIDGLISEAAGMVGERASQEGWFDVSTFKEPYRCEGKKTMGYEIAEGFNWRLPEVIIYPTGGGTGLVGMWKAFDELESMGWLESRHRPRMVAVQAEGCAPIVKAFHNGARYCEFWPDAHTIATGLRVPKSFADFIILNILRQSGGTAITVTDEEIILAQGKLAAREGILAAPEGAATLAALGKLFDEKWLDADDKIVLFNTGTRLKYLRKNGQASIS